MPELPEVETIRKDLCKSILNKKIVDVKVSKRSMVEGSVKKFMDDLLSNQLVDIGRTGKLLIFKLKKGNRYLLAHMKMTGQLVYALSSKKTPGGHNFPKLDELPNKYSHIIICFSDKSKLYFNDMRQFGYMKVVSREELEKIKLNFGIEPLQSNFTWENFKTSIKGKKTNIKVFLLNQKNIAGIGNIYADEILFDAKIRPNRKIERISEKELRRIYVSAEKIIKKAIHKRGTTFSDYVDGNGHKGNFTSYLKVYDREGEKCKRCRGNIKKIRVGGRGTYFCPNCQK
jgi:formamidopyrimidine-DNA glycosylase